MPSVSESVSIPLMGDCGLCISGIEADGPCWGVSDGAVCALTPDNGNATIEASNTAALKDAHSKILAAQQDFVAARADAETTIQDLASFKVSASANATATASTSAQ